MNDDVLNDGRDCIVDAGSLGVRTLPKIVVEAGGRTLGSVMKRHPAGFERIVADIDALR